MIFSLLVFVPTKAQRNFAQFSSHCELGILQHCVIPCWTAVCVFEPGFYIFDLIWLISLSEHLDITPSAPCTCCFVTFQAMSSMEISQNVGTPPGNLANDEDHLSGSEGTPTVEAPAPEPQPKPAAKRKPKPEPKGKADINLADYLTSTKRIRVRWDPILIDRDRSEGHVRGLNPDRVLARYDDLLRAPPPDFIDDLLLVPGVCMFCPVLFRFYSILGAI